jgi:DNA topoisomerase-1
MEGEAAEAGTLKEGLRLLGAHPDSGEEISVRRGPYGLYVQQGEPPPNGEKAAGEKAGGEKAGRTAKPKRSALPRGMDGDTMTLDQALGLLALPRVIGPHPETGEPLEAGLGRFGPYVRMGGVFASLDADDDVLSVGLNRAVDVLARKLASVRTLGNHPKDQAPVLVRKGRFGPYAQHGNSVATLPRDVSMDDITLDQAVKLLAEKGKVLAPRGAKAKGRGRAAKPAAKAPVLAPASKPKPVAKAQPAAKPKAKPKPKPAARPAARRKAAG